MRKKISQNEAHNLKANNNYLRKRIDTLEWELKRFRMNYTAGKQIVTCEPGVATVWSVFTANKLGHVVLATVSGDKLILSALPLPSEAV